MTQGDEDKGKTLSQKMDELFGPVTEEDWLDRFDVNIDPGTYRPSTPEEIAEADEILRKEFRNDRAASRKRRRD
jgi:hypothetical protein